MGNSSGIRCSRGAPHAPGSLPRFLVRDVSRDHLVHGLARMANAFFADRDVDRGHALVGRDALDLLARHDAHEPGGHAVEPRGRLLGPDEAVAAPPRRGRLGGLEPGPGEERVPAGPELLAAHGLLDHRECPLAGDDGDLPRARVLLDPRLGAPAQIGVRHFAEEEPMPGVRVKWSADARDALREVTDAYLRRPAKARIEKHARSRKIPVITCQWALPMIEETVGREKLGAGWDTLLARTRFEPAQAPATGGSGNGFVWTEEATARLNRVPAGFMRDMTREEVERVATDKGVTTIDVVVCEEGIGHARETMNEVIAGYVSNKKPR